MTALRPLVFLAAATALSHAGPLPEGSCVDLLVVPVGPGALAEFELDHTVAPPAPAKPGAKSDSKSGTAARQGGSGVRVKQQDPLEIPPREVYLKQGAARYFRIPCFFNAVSTPVRVPVGDTDLTFLLKTSDTKNTFESLETCRLPGATQCVLVLLTKPLTEKKWTQPKVTMIPVPPDTGSQLLLAKATTTLLISYEVTALNDYGKFHFTITQQMVDDVKSHIALKKYPKPADDLTRVAESSRFSGGIRYGSAC